MKASTPTPEALAALARWVEDDRSGGYCPKYTPYTVRRMYGLRKADLRALEAAGLVKSEGKVETYEVHLDFGRGNRALRHQYREYYWTTKEQK